MSSLHDDLDYSQTGLKLVSDWYDDDAEEMYEKIERRKRIVDTRRVLDDIPRSNSNRMHDAPDDDGASLLNDTKITYDDGGDEFGHGAADNTEEDDFSELMVELNSYKMKSGVDSLNPHYFSQFALRTMERMGYIAGQGLGCDGAGITKPIEANTTRLYSTTGLGSIKLAIDLPDLETFVQPSISYQITVEWVNKLDSDDILTPPDADVERFSAELEKPPTESLFQVEEESRQQTQDTPPSNSDQRQNAFQLDKEMFKDLLRTHSSHLSRQDIRRLRELADRYHKQNKSWVSLGARTLSYIDDTYCDLVIQQTLFNTKSQLDDIADDVFLDARNRSNPYEKLKRECFQNRAALKMAELDAECGQIFTSPPVYVEELKRNPYAVMYFGDVCAGPGGFSEFMLTVRKWKSKGFGFTLKESNDFKLDRFNRCSTPQVFQPYYGDGTGDVTNTSNLVSFSNEVHQGTGGQMLHCMMADGGFSVQGKENYQELLSRQLFLCQCIAALISLRQGGVCVIKMFDTFLRFTVDCIYLMRLSFTSISIVKPNQSRPANSERYLVCKGLRIKGGVNHPVASFLLRVNHFMNQIDPIAKQVDLLGQFSLNLNKGNLTFVPGGYLSGGGVFSPSSLNPSLELTQRAVEPLPGLYGDISPRPPTAAPQKAPFPEPAQDAGNIPEFPLDFESTHQALAVYPKSAVVQEHPAYDPPAQDEESNIDFGTTTSLYAEGSINMKGKRFRAQEKRGLGPSAANALLEDTSEAGAGYVDPGQTIVSLVPLSLHDEDFKTYIRKWNEEYAQVQTRWLQRILLYINDPNLPSDDQDSIRLRCLQRWKITSDFTKESPSGFVHWNPRWGEYWCDPRSLDRYLNSLIEKAKREKEAQSSGAQLTFLGGFRENKGIYQGSTSTNTQRRSHHVDTSNYFGNDQVYITHLKYFTAFTRHLALNTHCIDLSVPLYWCGLYMDEIFSDVTLDHLKQHQEAYIKSLTRVMCLWFKYLSNHPIIEESKEFPPESMRPCSVKGIPSWSAICLPPGAKRYVALKPNSKLTAKSLIVTINPHDKLRISPQSREHPLLADLLSQPQQAQPQHTDGGSLRRFELPSSVPMKRISIQDDTNSQSLTHHTSTSTPVFHQFPPDTIMDLFIVPPSKNETRQIMILFDAWSLPYPSHDLFMFDRLHYADRYQSLRALGDSLRLRETGSKDQLTIKSLELKNLVQPAPLSSLNINNKGITITGALDLNSFIKHYHGIWGEYPYLYLFHTGHRLTSRAIWLSLWQPHHILEILEYIDRKQKNPELLRTDAFITNITRSFNISRDDTLHHLQHNTLKTYLQSRIKNKNDHKTAKAFAEYFHPYFAILRRIQQKAVVNALAETLLRQA